MSSISNAGGFGVIACGAMTPELLDAERQAAMAAVLLLRGLTLALELVSLL